MEPPALDGAGADVRQLFHECANLCEFRVKITRDWCGYVAFNGEPGEPIVEWLLDDEVKRWYLPDVDDNVKNLVEIYL